MQVLRLMRGRRIGCGCRGAPLRSLDLEEESLRTERRRLMDDLYRET